MSRSMWLCVHTTDEVNQWVPCPDCLEVAQQTAVVHRKRIARKTLANMNMLGKQLRERPLQPRTFDDKHLYVCMSDVCNSSMCYLCACACACVGVRCVLSSALAFIRMTLIDLRACMPTWIEVCMHVCKYVQAVCCDFLSTYGPRSLRWSQMILSNPANLEDSTCHITNIFISSCKVS